MSDPDDDEQVRIKLAFACVGAATRGDYEGLDVLIADTADHGDLRRLCRNVAYIAAGMVGAHVQCHLDDSGEQITADQVMAYVHAAEKSTLQDQDQQHDRKDQ